MKSKQKQTARFVSGKIRRLSQSGNESAMRASLARLRHGIGKTPGSNPDLWEVTLRDMPEEIAGSGNRPSASEWAAHIALTLFALHQQSKDIRTQPVHEEKISLGTACGLLARRNDNQDRIKKRFDKVLTASSIEELAHHLRGIVQLLSAQGLSMDYADLAESLYVYQMPDGPDGVRLKWGRDYYAQLRYSNENKNSEEAE
jgi:CRISPR system Cascade subunit CasB